MSTEPLLLAVDLGTSGMKVALITVKGKVLGWESEAIGIQITADGGVEQSPDEWWAAFLAASKRLLKRAASPEGGIDFTTRRAGGVLLHAGRGHRPGQQGWQRPDELRPVDGHARRTVPA